MELGTFLLIILIVLIIWFFVSVKITYYTGEPAQIPVAPTEAVVTTSPSILVPSKPVTDNQLLDTATQANLAKIQNKFYYDNQRLVPNY